MTAEAKLADPSMGCDAGTRRNAKEYKLSWAALQAALRRDQQGDPGKQRADLG